MPRPRKIIKPVQPEPFPSVLGWRDRVSGVAYKLGDKVDCDTIIPVRFCTRPGLEVYRRHCLTVYDPDFPTKAREGLIIIAGREFGRGSANDNAVWALASCGVKAVVAVSFAHIFHRNAINIGFIALTSPTLVNESETGDELELDLVAWKAYNHFQGSEHLLDELSPLEFEILKAGGLIPYLNALRGEKSQTLLPPALQHPPTRSINS